MPKQETKLERIPGTKLLVPDNVPRVLWKLMSEERADQQSAPLPASLGAAGTPFAWEECSDWLQALTARLNDTLAAATDAAGPADAAAPTSAATAAATATAAGGDASQQGETESAGGDGGDGGDEGAAGATGDAAAAKEKSGDGERAAEAQPAMRFKCSFGSCSVMSTADKPLLVCGRCRNARYCTREHQRADWKEHKRLCTTTSAAQKELQQLKHICCTQLMQSVLNAEVALSFALARQRLGPGAMLVGMRDFVHLTQDTPAAARTRQVWLAYATLAELAKLKDADPRLVDVECAAREMHEQRDSSAVVQRDFFCFLDDTGFSLCIGSPRLLDDTQRTSLVDGAQTELTGMDMLAIDLPTQRRFTCRFHNIEVRQK